MIGSTLLQTGPSADTARLYEAIHRMKPGSESKSKNTSGESFKGGARSVAPRSRMRAAHSFAIAFLRCSSVPEGSGFDDTSQLCGLLPTNSSNFPGQLTQPRSPHAYRIRILPNRLASHSFCRLERIEESEGRNLPRRFA